MSQDKSKYMQINLVKKGKKDKKRASSKQHIFIDYKPPSTSTRGPNLKFSFFSKLSPLRAFSLKPMFLPSC